MGREAYVGTSDPEWNEAVQNVVNSSIERRDQFHVPALCDRLRQMRICASLLLLD